MPIPERLKILREQFDSNGIDAIWIFNQENRRYFSNFKAEDLLCGETAGSLLISRTNAVLLTDSRYETEAKEQAVEHEVFIYKKGVAEGLLAVAENEHIRSLGVEENSISLGRYNKLSRCISETAKTIELMPVAEIAEQMRIIKDANEIRLMEKSADTISFIIDTVIGEIKPGISEKEIARRIGFLAEEAGAECMAFPSIVASGPNAALPHASPTNRLVTKGDPVTIDIGVKLEGYCSDITRTIFIGEPSRELKNIYNVVRKAQLAGIAAVLPDVESGYPDMVAREIIKDSGYEKYFGHGLGHGVGMAVHEAPRLASKQTTILKEGMVVTVEPGIYIPGLGGVRLEETVIIEKNKPKIITKSNAYYDF